MSDQYWIPGLAYSPMPGRQSPRRRYIKSPITPSQPSSPTGMSSPNAISSPLPSPPITPNSTTPPPPKRSGAATPPVRPKSRTAMAMSRRLGHDRAASMDSMVRSLGAHDKHPSNGHGQSASPPNTGSVAHRDAPSSPSQLPLPNSPGGTPSHVSAQLAQILSPGGSSTQLQPGSANSSSTQLAHIPSPKRIMLRELLPRILATPALEGSPDDLGRFGRLQTLALHIFQDPCAFDQEELGRFLAQPMAIDALRSFSDTVLDAWGRSAPAAIRIPPNAPIRIVDPNADLTNLEASPLDLCSAATCACLLWTNMHPERWLQIARASHERGGGALDLTAEVRPCPPNMPSDELESGPAQSGYVSAITRSGMPVMTVRVKLPAGWDASKVARVRTALQPWQKASHPAMLPLLGVTFSNDANGTPGLSLVYAAPQRTKLTTALANGMIKTPAEAYRAMRAVAKALRYLHQARPALVHGGVRPDTVLISSSGDTALAESGIIKIIEELKTPGERTMPSGSVRYAAPELFGENSALAKRTARSDVYAFGCVLYEVFSGEAPFAEISAGRVPPAMYQGQTLRRPAAGVGLGINDELWSLITKCTAFDLSRRPTMAQVVQMLGAARAAENRRSPTRNRERSSPTEMHSPDGTHMNGVGMGVGPALEPSALMALVESASKIAAPPPPIPVK